jgi:hypothetical protein
MPLKDHKIQGQSLQRDLAYWKSYHISEKTLNFCVKSVHKILNENSCCGQFPQEPLHLRMWSLTR